MNYRRGPEAPVMRYTLASLVSRKAVTAGASAAEGVFPKGTRIAHYIRCLQTAADAMNPRPRVTIGFGAPADRLPGSPLLIIPGKHQLNCFRRSRPAKEKGPDK
jgi:hypothetical protein